jgi:hypothetical protein
MASANEKAAAGAAAATLFRVSLHLEEGYHTTLMRRKIEIAVFTCFGDYLFVCKYKHSLLPCSPNELRTSYDR